VIVPVVTFEVKTYWVQFYSNKPFFKDRDRFASININIHNGGKAAPGATGSGGQASITGSINKKPAGNDTSGANGGAAAVRRMPRKRPRPARRSQAMQRVSIRGPGNNNCPAGQKKLQGARQCRSAAACRRSWRPPSLAVLPMAFAPPALPCALQFFWPAGQIVVPVADGLTRCIA